MITPASLVMSGGGGRGGGSGGGADGGDGRCGGKGSGDGGRPGRNGGDTGGGRGGGDGATRVPQSAQSWPYLQLQYSLPSPPSSQLPSLVRWLFNQQSLRQTSGLGGAGGNGGGGDG